MTITVALPTMRQPYLAQVLGTGVIPEASPRDRQGVLEEADRQSIEDLAAEGGEMVFRLPAVRRVRVVSRNER